MTDFNDKVNEAKVIYSIFMDADRYWDKHMRASEFLLVIEDSVLSKDIQSQVYDAFTSVVKNQYRQLAFRAHLYYDPGERIDLKKCYSEFDRICKNLRANSELGNIFKKAACHILLAYVGSDIIDLVCDFDYYARDMASQLRQHTLKDWFDEARNRS